MYVHVVSNRSVLLHNSSASGTTKAIGRADLLEKYTIMYVYHDDSRKFSKKKITHTLEISVVTYTVGIITRRKSSKASYLTEMKTIFWHTADHRTR